MARKAYTLFFPQTLIKEPIMFLVARDNNLMLNIRRAKITSEFGEATIELEGEEGSIRKAVSELQNKGVKVEPVSGDIIE
jgi:ABC-type methionine transport system ATPase subunit